MFHYLNKEYLNIHWYLFDNLFLYNLVSINNNSNQVQPVDMFQIGMDSMYMHLLIIHNADLRNRMDKNN